jgi:hypothetical protein
MALDSTPGRFVTYSPVVEPDPVETSLAPRLDALDGKVVGFLANGKPNADALLDAVEAVLTERYAFREVVRAAKPNVSRPAPAEIAQQLVDRCDLVITAIGD